MQRTVPPHDRVASVYFAATEYDKDQPVHLVITDPDICINRGTEEYGNPCENYCLANIREMVEHAICK